MDVQALQADNQDLRGRLGALTRHHEDLQRRYTQLQAQFSQQYHHYLELLTSSAR